MNKKQQLQFMCQKANRNVTISLTYAYSTVDQANSPVRRDLIDFDCDNKDVCIGTKHSNEVSYNWKICPKHMELFQ